MTDKRTGELKIWFFGGAGVLLFLALTWLMRPVYDPDFFWHLKTGEWIWQTRSFPIPDPFSFTTPIELDWRQRFILSSYWLSQLFFYGFYHLGGWWGIVFLRLFVVMVLAGTLYAFRQGRPLIWFVFSSIVLVLILESYPIERPQFFSFVLFAGLFLYLDKRMRWKRPVRFAMELMMIALIMILWANLHGGVILGQGLLCLTALFVLVRIFQSVRRTEPIQDELKIVGLAIVGLVASFVNPNGFQFLRLLTEMGGADSTVYAVNEEYYSMLKVWGDTGDITILFCWVIMLLAAVGVVRNYRSFSPFRVVVLCGTGVYAFLQVRYVPFFLLAALPCLASSVESGSWKRWVTAGVTVFGLFTLVVLGGNDIKNLESIRRDGFIPSQTFPVKVAERVASLGLNGRLFNSGRWGGYLLWRLGPSMQVYRDGRVLDEKVIRDGFTAQMTHLKGPDGRPAWKSIFEKYRIDHAVLPLREGSGPNALAIALYRDTDWTPLVMGDNAVFFTTRKIPK